MGEIVVRKIDVRNADSSFWNGLHALRRARHLEEDSEDPLEPDEVFEIRTKQGMPFTDMHWYEMTDDGEMVSWFCGERTSADSPEYPTNKHLFSADAYVRADSRRQGKATRWLLVVAELMRELECTAFGFRSQMESGQAFAKWLGIEPKYIEVESRVEMATIDWAMMKSWAEEGAKRSPSTRLEIYDGPMPEALRAAHTQQLSALLNTMPFQDLDVGTLVVTPETMKGWYEIQASVGEKVHTVLTREPDEVVSGVTETCFSVHRPETAEQWFTGVRPDMRGRGLGKWIKAAMALHLRDLYPEVKWIRTENANSNQAMLGINTAMGFKPHRTFIDYQIARSELEAKIVALDSVVARS